MASPQSRTSSRSEGTMTTTSNVLFSWDDVEKLPELRRLELVLNTLPDEELVAALEAERVRGTKRLSGARDVACTGRRGGVRTSVHRLAGARVQALPLRGFARHCWARAGLTRCLAKVRRAGFSTARGSVHAWYSWPSRAAIRFPAIGTSHASCAKWSSTGVWSRR